jgi:hypothetical protein
MTTRSNAALIVCLVLQAASISAQDAGTVVAPKQTEEADRDAWSFEASGYGYIVPADQSYFSAIFRADRGRAHLEARYNYEDRHTGSIWVGYNVSVGDTLTLEVTPMVGGIFGNTRGVAPGYLLTLTHKKISFYSEGEFVFDTRNSDNSFFYSWNELTYSPATWLRVGLVAQRTRAYHTPLDVQRGLFAGVSYRRLDFTTYVFNLGWTHPTVVVATAVTF